LVADSPAVAQVFLEVDSLEASEAVSLFRSNRKAVRCQEAFRVADSEEVSE